MLGAQFTCGTARLSDGSVASAAQPGSIWPFGDLEISNLPPGIPSLKRCRLCRLALPSPSETCRKKQDDLQNQSIGVRMNP